jgi:hypothetical protein
MLRINLQVQPGWIFVVHNIKAFSITNDRLLNKCFILYVTIKFVKHWRCDQVCTYIVRHARIVVEMTNILVIKNFIYKIFEVKHIWFILYKIVYQINVTAFELNKYCLLGRDAICHCWLTYVIWRCASSNFNRAWRHMPETCTVKRVSVCDCFTFWNFCGVTANNSFVIFICQIVTLSFIIWHILSLISLSEWNWKGQ